MRQHYLLGSYLRQDYLTALNLSSVFNGNEVDIFSDSTPRCVESAYAHMSGWFPLETGGEIPQGLDPSFLQPPFQQQTYLKSASAVDEPGTTEGYQPVPVKIGVKTYFPNCPNSV
jgi:hypothetical protein